MSIERSERLLRGHISKLVSLYRGGGSSTLLTPKELQRAGDCLLKLQRGLTGGRSLAGAGYMNEQPLLNSYLLYYWPVSYLQVSLALSSKSKLLSQLGMKNVVRVLDLGCGPGPASVALVDLLPRQSTIEVTLVDYSNKAMKLAEAMLPAGHAHATKVRKDLMRESLDDLPGPWDVVLISHTLNELWKDDGDQVEKRHQLLEQVGTKLAEGGFCFLCEPALLLTSRNLMKLRDTLVEGGWHLLGPCMADCPCPALLAGEGHTCHCEVAWKPGEPMASLAKTANLDRESVKMTYFFFQKGGRELAPAFAGGAVHALVVSEAMTNKSGRVRFLFCDGEKRFSISAPKGDPHAREEGFFGLKRYDEVVVHGVQTRGEGLGFGSDSHLEILSKVDG
ncbi:MAG: small ribosomal subunit Rsm22 family protein [Sphaerochaetaceae bacterium]|nr:small ribosomal subunit Rsm22 family protein [Sphaerochaetaceae bacterium]